MLKFFFATEYLRWALSEPSDYYVDLSSVKESIVESPIVLLIVLVFILILSLFLLSSMKNVNS